MRTCLQSTIFEERKWDEISSKYFFAEKNKSFLALKSMQWTDVKSLQVLFLLTEGKCAKLNGRRERLWTIDLKEPKMAKGRGQEAKSIEELRLLNAIRECFQNLFLKQKNVS